MMFDLTESNFPHFRYEIPVELTDEQKQAFLNARWLGNMNYFPNPGIGNMNGDANYFFPQTGNNNNMGTNGLYGQNMPNGYHQQYAVNGFNNFIGSNGFNALDGLNNFNSSGNSSHFSMFKPNPDGPKLPTSLMAQNTDIDPILLAMYVLFIFC